MKTYVKMKSILFVAAIIALTTFSSCKKDSKAKSKTELLTQAGWKLIKSEEKTNNGAWLDVTGNPPACEKDDISLFKTNNTFEQNEGASKCSPTDPQIIETGTWAFGANETTITVTIGGGAGIATIEQLNETTLVVYSSFTAGGTTYYDRSTYSH